MSGSAPVRKPHCKFSHDEAQNIVFTVKLHTPMLRTEARVTVKDVTHTHTHKKKKKKKKKKRKKEKKKTPDIFGEMLCQVKTCSAERREKINTYKVIQTVAVS